MTGKDFDFEGLLCALLDIHVTKRHFLLLSVCTVILDTLFPLNYVHTQRGLGLDLLLFLSSDAHNHVDGYSGTFGGVRKTKTTTKCP